MLIWIFYFLGQLAHAGLRANLVVKSKINGVAGYGAYLKDKWAVIVARLFLATCGFMLYLGADTWFPGFVPRGGSMEVQAAVAGIFGYASDSILDNLLSKLGLSKEVPPPQIPEPPKA